MWSSARTKADQNAIRPPVTHLVSYDPSLERFATSARKAQVHRKTRNRCQTLAGQSSYLARCASYSFQLPLPTDKRFRGLLDAKLTASGLFCDRRASVVFDIWIASAFGATLAGGSDATCAHLMVIYSRCIVQHAAYAV